MLKTLTLILLLAVSASAGHNFTGRVTDSFGRGISSAKLRLQRNVCEPLFEFEPVFEQYAYTNTFGYYSFNNVPAECLSYSVRILGARRYDWTGFYPYAYWYGFKITDYASRDFLDQDFQYIGEH